MKLKQVLLFVVILLASCFLSFSVFSQAPTAGLVAYWRMNGNYTDAGPNAIHGTNVGSTATTNKAGTASSAMNFSNPGSTVSQYATHPVNANLNFSAAQDFSIAFLFYVPSWIHNLGFYDNNLNYNGIGIWMWDIGSRVIQFNFRNGSLASTPITMAKWYHVTCTKAGTILRIYLDGLLVATGSPGTQTPTYSFPGKFGTMSFNGQTPPEYNGFTGKLDEFRIYNRALTATEIAQTASNALPLKMGDFTAFKKPAGIQLNWETITEQNTSHFEIERSDNGINFNTIGSVNANGNSTDKKYYSFTDSNPLPKSNFYRLKMLDIDGIFTYSRVIAIKNENMITLDLFPNPTTDVLQVQIPSERKETTKINIIDAAGKQIYSQSVQLNEGTNAISIPVDHLQNGSYYLVVENESGRQSKLFIKM
jgi:hypothetical protein